MNSRSSQLLLYTAVEAGAAPERPPACCGLSPPTPLRCGQQGGQSTGRGVWAPGPRTELCHRCLSGPFLSWASASPSAKWARGHTPSAPLLGAPHSQQPAATLSSAPSAQSLSPSQSQRSGTHTWVPGQEKELGPHVLPSVGEEGDAETQDQEQWLGRRDPVGLCVCWGGHLSLLGPPPHPDPSPRPRLTAVSRLVRAVPAVIAAVTEPLLGDAAMVLALKLGLGAELVWGSWTEVTVRSGRDGGCTVGQMDATGWRGRCSWHR